MVKSSDSFQRDLRLLVPGSSLRSSEERAVELLGESWMLTMEKATSEAARRPYACVSYAWGSERATNPIDERELMSTRTIAAVEAAIRIRRPSALWVDAFSVPFEEPARSNCLRSMGRIYAEAAEVIVVLSNECAPLLERVATDQIIDRESLLAFETDAWLTRVWTYQEIVNGSEVRFMTEGGSDVAVEAERVLNRVGEAINEYKKDLGCDSFGFRSRHPRLDCLEDLILDWKMAAYLERSAYSVMSGMVRRQAVRPEDRFHAMVGALDEVEASMQPNLSAHPADYFMSLCEAKGDFSFLYSSGGRSSNPGRRWRPEISARLEPVFSWPTHGDGQKGVLHEDHLHLEGMWLLKPSELATEARDYLLDWLGRSESIDSTEPIPVRLLRKLAKAGFRGGSDYLILENGIFFPQLDIGNQTGITVAIATGMLFPFGAVGIAVQRSHSGEQEFRSAGVYIGKVSMRDETLDLH